MKSFIFFALFTLSFNETTLSEKITSKNLHLPFINISWSKENVLQNTLNNFASTKLKYKFLDNKIDIDTIIDIENRK